MTDDTADDDFDDLGVGIAFLLSDLHSRMVDDGLIPSGEDPDTVGTDQEQSGT